MISGRTRVFALLGDPVAHSLSPAMQNAAFTALGLDAVYVPIRCGVADLPGLMRSLAAAGGGGNITVPHKLAAAAVLDGTAGSPPICNTFWGEDGVVAGTETDSAGILGAWRALGSPAGDWLLVGTGGSAVAATRAARTVGAGIVVRSRSPERAAQFRAHHAPAGGGNGQVGLVVNCTPLGLAGNEGMPLPPAEMPEGALALDLVYAAGGTPWVRALAAAGIAGVDGREVLLGQGIAAFERWFPGVPAPAEVMRAALARGLG